MYLLWGLALIFIAFCYIFSYVLSPFLLSLALSYVLEPAVAKMERFLKIGRSAASFLLTAFIFGSCVVLIVLLGPLIYSQLLSLIHQVSINQENLFQRFFDVLAWLDKLSPQIVLQLKQSLTEVVKEFASAVAITSKALLHSGRAAVDILSIAFITPLITFYLLRDFKQITHAIRSIVPLRYGSEFAVLSSSMHRVMMGFFRGQFIVCSILACYYEISFYFIGVHYWLGLGVLFGVLIFIPYLGALIAITFCIVISATQFGFGYQFLAVIAVLIFGQILEGGFLTPKFVGENVGLHPVFIIFSLLAGWSVMGLIGVIIAVPVAAIIGVLLKFGLIKYQNSEFYSLR